jgi:lysophospholipase L1-like esterase
MSNRLKIALVWLVIFLVGFIAMEWYARKVQGYIVWSWPLEQSVYIEMDKVKIWNEQFVAENDVYFREWPILLETFAAEEPTPRYLFKTNQRVARHGNAIVPAQPGEEVFWSSNAWGFRGAEFPVEKPADVIRIVCMGASTTEGTFSDRETYPYFLQQELDQRYPAQKIEVINAGHHGQGVADMQALLQQRVLPLQPDIILYYQAHNDIWASTFVEEELPCTIGNTIGDEQHCWLLNAPGWYRWLYQHSAIFALLANQSDWTRQKPPPMKHTFVDSPENGSAERYGEHLREIVSAAKAQGVEIVLASYITLAHEGLDVSYAENPGIFNDLFKKFYPLTPGEIGRMHERFNQVSSQVATEFDAPYVDMAAQFPKEKQYFPYDLIHFNAAGNQLLATLFADFLEQEGIIAAQR